MLTNFETEEVESQKKDSTDQFIEDYITTQKARIQTRKLIQEMLFFASCQVASASLAVLLFQFAVQVIFTTWLCLFVAWIPSLSGLCEINFQRSEEGWELRIMNRPIITIIKFTSSVAIVTCTVYSVADEITQTTNQINAIYAEIQQYEQPRLENFLPPFLPQIFLASIGVVLLVNFVRGFRN
jgi:hypothetical protein